MGIYFVFLPSYKHLNNNIMNYLTPGERCSSIVLAVICCLCCVNTMLRGEGTANLRSAEGDPVLLFVGHSNFGQFASYNGPENSRLNFRIAEAGEVVYLGLGRAYRNDGLPESLGQYHFRIRRASDGAIVHGPVRISTTSANLENYAQAAAGPAAMAGGGYPTDEHTTFTADAAGEYFIEFDQASSFRPRFIGLWDITVAQDGVVQPGRVYSRNWAFRVPELDPQLPECAFGAELSTKFYSYTTDGFVTEIDFTDSGFQPLSFTLAFNRTGPGTTGNLLLDRQSVAETNATDNVAEHLIFLQEPDANLFPDGSCGALTVGRQLACDGVGVCIPVAATLPGQVQILLDFDGNGRYDAEIDRILVHEFTEDQLSACVSWDGTTATGALAPAGSTVNATSTYTQGVQHWALYDGELMRNGFCVTPVRPVCGDGMAAALYYDDTNIPADPGTGAPRSVLNGCDCATADCRTWTNFSANADANCMVNNDNTSGYGDRNTLNTWWFANSVRTTSLDMPVSLIAVENPLQHCPGGVTPIELNYLGQGAVSTVAWTGPNGPIAASDDSMRLSVTESGTYSATVVDAEGCSSTLDYVLTDVSCTLSAQVVEVHCSDNGTESDPTDDTFTATIAVAGNNSATFALAGGEFAYGEAVTVGPYPVSGGDMSFTISDATYGCCSQTVPVPAPMACSNGCAITSGVILSTDCVDPGTPTDPTDDTFTFDMRLEGINLGAGWTDNYGTAGSYDEVVTFGPFPVSAGDPQFTFTDNDDPDCRFFATVQAPDGCSDECVLNPIVSTSSCDDNGTVFDPTDDTFTFELRVDAINPPVPAYSFDGTGVYLYGQTYTMGPYPANRVSDDFMIAALGGASCTLAYALAGADQPTACGTAACSMDLTDYRIVCGSDADGQPQYEVEVLVNTENPAAQGWAGADGRTGSYGTYVSAGTVQPGGGVSHLTLHDQDNGACTVEVAVMAPAVEVTCPEDADRIDHKVSLQQFSGALTPDSPFDAASEDVCWLDDEDRTTVGRRYRERFTLRHATDSTGDVSNQLRLFSFYLYSAPGERVSGAVFSQRMEEVIDCCQLTNDGPVGPAPTGATSVPELADSLHPAGMVLRQRFSVMLRPDETYSLVASTRAANATASFAWTILSADQLPLEVRRRDMTPPQDTFFTTAASFALLTTERAGLTDDAGSLRIFGVPTIDSLCGTLTTAFTDDTLGTCVSAQIVRTFDLTLGDTTLAEVCEQTIDFRSLSLEDLSWPPARLRLGCADTFPQTDAGWPAPRFAGWPFVYRAGTPRPLNDARVDQLRISYADTAVVRPADGGTTVLRSWRVIDDCRMDTARFVQEIKLDAAGAPFFVCPVSNHYCPIVEEDIMLWPLDPYACTADIVVPDPEILNLCDSTGWTFVTEVLRLTVAGDTVLLRRLEETDGRLVTDLMAGDYLLRYTADHPTETVEDRYCRFRVADLAPPNMICKTLVNVSLPGSGVIAVPVVAIDQFSYDNCRIDSLHVRHRLLDSLGWSVWEERFLTFDCAYVGVDLEVQLRAIDPAGNVNYCTSTVRVNDNTAPYCTGLETQVISCDELPSTFSAYDTTQLRRIFGMPRVVDNCSAAAIELTPIVTTDGCRPERIRRRFRAVDQHGNPSVGLFVQDIYVNEGRGYAIRFPQDTVTDCTDLVDTLQIIGSGCDSITYRFVDVLLPTEGEECRYVQRNFVVTNWCEWDGVSDPVRVGRDENCSGTEGDAAVWLIRTADSLYVDVDSLFENNLPAADALCDGNPAGYIRAVKERPLGRYLYAQRFKIFDEVPPTVVLTMLDTICADTAFCRTDVTVGIEVADACNVDEVGIIVGVDINNNGFVESTSADLGGIAGTFPNYTFTTSMPIGTHRYVVTVTDDCGNATTTERVFRVTDCYVPALVCRQDRTYDLTRLLEEGDIDGDGVVEEAAALVEAIDLAQCNFLDCSGELNFSLNRVGEPADVNATSIFLDCEDRYEVFLEVYVWDNALNPFAVQPDGTVGGRNWRMCVVRVSLQDPTLACNSCEVGERITLNGAVRTVAGAPLANVTVRTQHSESKTGAFGTYQLAGTVGESFRIEAELDDDRRAGLSTIDLVLLQMHLLGQQTITDPLLLLTADVDRNGSVELSDLIALRALILMREDLYPPGNGWRFVDASWDGSGPAREHIDLPAADACTSDLDFVGLRLGDLNGSWGADAGAGGGRSAGVDGRPTALPLAERSFVAGETVTVDVPLPTAEAYAGGQLALGWATAALRLRDVTTPELNGRTQTRRDRGSLWISWDKALAPGAELARLTFTARTAGRLTHTLYLEETGGLTPELYAATDLAVRPVYVQWTDTADTDGDDEAPGVPDIGPAGPDDVLLGAYPNPASHYARVGVHLVTAQTVRLTLTDAAGRRVRDRKVRLGAGEGWLRLDVRDLAAGLYAYRIETGRAGLAGRLVVR